MLKEVTTDQGLTIWAFFQDRRLRCCHQNHLSKINDDDDGAVNLLIGATIY